MKLTKSSEHEESSSSIFEEDQAIFAPSYFASPTTLSSPARVTGQKQDHDDGSKGRQLMLSKSAIMSHNRKSRHEQSVSLDKGDHSRLLELLEGFEGLDEDYLVEPPTLLETARSSVASNLKVCEDTILPSVAVTPKPRNENPIFTVGATATIAIPNGRFEDDDDESMGTIEELSFEVSDGDDVFDLYVTK